MSAVKENLRSTIQTRRVTKGLQEINLERGEKQLVEKLSEYDEERRRIRRERNKEAANRCRKKRREKIEVLEKIASELQQSNKSLENDIAEMRKEVKELEGFLENHQCNIAAT
ncbi:proto-oncogene c-Fos-like isoform X1 [Actinia tenebrosa]|uniref:Proto-oncogene c-Fos-like isoform X1 n=1 Tax=Actinia tenebrosa TaxID=6105 RepID=A0A6P8GZ29_ACTTE|nr:proto-oncogene c-Fos-like isoform X1 [Actinia tenebrosa]XP_031549473.1 proto-oncogene c-Fos-like isoform X1 [Actinia tenebrosa]XP_031549474.1 proto-oncogene c-Fos-like isoform X1 [Actinia tenebrosa]XP_031549475.1 proto-oncogene c-Fos-like isoform X1 [Actinia tenebrosa]XP_031549476.1 proto-oncogene c-Fos-like isoform X1 [Actinia tenebrosa]XP_031549477.1 proto-oncogene c-Fos-like isoform X1 [Actinia tenebrosa]